jgi:post-segregation antitoxin (ccd killing protein)
MNVIQNMANEVVVTARISADLKDRLEELDINVSGLIRKSLEAEVRRLEMKALQELSKEASDILRRVPPEEIVKNIRAGRESR